MATRPISRHLPAAISGKTSIFQGCEISTTTARASCLGSHLESHLAQTSRQHNVGIVLPSYETGKVASSKYVQLDAIDILCIEIDSKLGVDQ